MIEKKKFIFSKDKYKICEECPELDKKAAMGPTCKQCGCLMKIKTNYNIINKKKKNTILNNHNSNNNNNNN